MSVKKSILFGLAILDEVLREFRDPGGFVSFSYENMYGFVPQKYQKKNLYSMTHKLKEGGELENTSSGTFQITPLGKSRINNLFPLLRFVNRPWDGKWRIVGFDIEEKNRVLRNNLRDSLQKFGFGMFQKSLYVSALPLEEEVRQFLASHKEILPNVYIFVSDKFFLEDQEGFVERTFNLIKINDAYQKLLFRIKNDLSDEEKLKVLREFFEVSTHDPFLPDELLPEGFLRKEVWKSLTKNNIFNFRE